MLNDLLLMIDEAHQSHVTEVIHFTPNILLSSSKDGFIKVWNVNGNTISLDKISSDNLFATYATQGKVTQILFLDLSFVGGMKVLSAGTNDNRVLFFLGDQFQYNPLILPENNVTLN
jgi:WD40 repeat protein